MGFAQRESAGLLAFVIREMRPGIHSSIALNSSRSNIGGYRARISNVHADLTASWRRRPFVAPARWRTKRRLSLVAAGLEHLPRGVHQPGPHRSAVVRDGG